MVIMSDFSFFRVSRSRQLLSWISRLKSRDDEGVRAENFHTTGNEFGIISSVRDMMICLLAFGAAIYPNAAILPRTLASL